MGLLFSPKDITAVAAVGVEEVVVEVEEAVEVAVEIKDSIKVKRTNKVNPKSNKVCSLKIQINYYSLFLFNFFNEIL